MANVSCEWFPNPPSGSWAEWATALVALLALAAAVWAGRAAWAQNKATIELLEVERERENRATQLEERRAAAEERAHQADSVAVWTERIPNHAPPFVAQIQNQSLLPIYELTVTFVAPDGVEYAVTPIGVARQGAHVVAIPSELTHAVEWTSITELGPGKR